MLPNAKLERVFSQVNIIKTDKRSLLSNDTLDDLLLLTSDNVPIEDFCANPAIDLWWKSKVRRPDQSLRKPYKKCSLELTSSTTDTERNECESESDSDACYSNTLTDWDSFMHFMF